MTVKELIEKLSNYNDNQLVAIIGDDLETPYFSITVDTIHDDYLDKENDIVILNT